MPPPVPQPTRRQMLLAGSALLGSGLLAACGQDGEDAAASSSVPTSSAPTSAAAS
ncbi:polysaccharide deacetylase, partial [Micrococcus luteus NCTC 2665]